MQKYPLLKIKSLMNFAQESEISLNLICEGLQQKSLFPPTRLPPTAETVCFVFSECGLFLPSNLRQAISSKELSLKLTISYTYISKCKGLRSKIISNKVLNGLNPESSIKEALNKNIWITAEILGQEILHLKVRKFATKVVCDKTACKTLRTVFFTFQFENFSVGQFFTQPVIVMISYFEVLFSLYF